ncbi:histone H2A-Bbd type 1-like [Pteropus medius]|uniref:Histone H2A n=1 Tax=Pteropus vampyrus TaxID=132908 RepID=A0A6P3R8H8_PTEVA|nr:histone H2A-Bbd type 1 [Pteropus vampyrus]XP_039704859.1 histone H2A-Bbd type 1-like [Pteropus giganteus]
MSGERRHHSSRRRKKRVLSRSTRAELQFPVSRVDRLLREGSNAHRMSWCTPVFFTGILEYLTANILDLAGKEAHNHHQVLITPEHVERAVDNSHLSYIFDDDIHPQVDEMPSPGK